MTKPSKKTSKIVEKFREILADLEKRDPDYIEIVQMLVDYEESLEKMPGIRGWEYDDLPFPLPPGKLSTLVQKGILRRVYKSRNIKEYRIRDIQKLKEALRVYTEPEEIPEETSKIPDDLFKIISGYDDLKRIFLKVVHKRKIVHFLLHGPPASAKSLFLLELARLPKARYVLGGSSTKAGLGELLTLEKPEYLLIDEFDKMNPEDLSILLSLCETGKVIETKYKRKREVQLKTVVFAAANDISRLPPEVLSRFQKIKFKGYTPKQFFDAVVTTLTVREGIERKLAEYIAKECLKRNITDVRQAIRIARLCDSEEEVRETLKILEKYNGIPVHLMKGSL